MFVEVTETIDYVFPEQKFFHSDCTTEETNVFITLGVQIAEYIGR